MSNEQKCQSSHAVCHPELVSGSQTLEIPKQVRNDSLEGIFG